MVTPKVVLHPAKKSSGCTGQQMLAKAPQIASVTRMEVKPARRHRRRRHRIDDGALFRDFYRYGPP